MEQHVCWWTMLSHWRHHRPHLSALQPNRNRYHHSGSKDNHLGLELGCACLSSLSGLFMETPAEGGFAPRHGLERGAVDVQVSRAALLVLLLQRSSPWGKVGSEGLQQGIWQLFALSSSCNVRGFSSSQLPLLQLPSLGLHGFTATPYGLTTLLPSPFLSAVIPCLSLPAFPQML